MKKSFLFFSLTFLFSACFLLFQGCVKDSCKKAYKYTYFQPVYKTTAEVKANIKNNTPREIEKPGKIYIRGNYIFLNEIDRGIHIIDNSDPAHPKNFAFIDIPGNLDIAVKDDILYADLYTDLVAIDISNPRQVVVKKFVENVFPHRYYGNSFAMDSSKVIAQWLERDTTVFASCEDAPFWAFESDRFFAATALNSSGGKSASPIGMGGSMARFALANQRLYTVGNSDLNTFNVSTAANPTFSNKKNLTWGIETIYPFKDRLFVGSTSGMFMFSISNPDNPQQIGQFNHVRSCDPVIADDDYAYVTLRSGTTCQGFSNQLDVLKLNNFTDPSLVKTYQMTNPHGLSKDGNTLFICDGTTGLKVYNAANVTNLQLITHITGIETYDVIAYNNLAIVVAKDGLYQYDYSDLNKIRLLSKLTIANK
jgi:hypothetical protein